MLSPYGEEQKMLKISSQNLDKINLYPSKYILKIKHSTLKCKEVVSSLFKSSFNNANKVFI